MPTMRRYRPLPAVVFAIVVSALVGGFFGRSALATDDSGKGWTTERAMSVLRGPKGRRVQIEIGRRGYERPIPVELARDEVYIPTVPAYFMIDATTGYIRMQDFGENTDHDVKHALRDLTSKGMKRLLFDIRGNPGGPLDQAIKVANEFLPKEIGRASCRERV